MEYQQKNSADGPEVEMDLLVGRCSGDSQGIVEAKVAGSGEQAKVRVTVETEVISVVDGHQVGCHPVLSEELIFLEAGGAEDFLLLFLPALLSQEPAAKARAQIFRPNIAFPLRSAFLVEL